ncbi:MAG: HAD hydrolase family protein [Salibacteraceae bacterium]
MSFLEKLHSIKAFIFDIDGVLTDGKVVLLPGGEQMRRMHSKDGYALQLAVKKGYFVGVISGSNSKEVKERLNALGITDVYLKSSDKADAMSEFIHSYHLEPHEVMYMGDDIPDIPAMQMIGLPSCPSDASPEVMDICDYIAKNSGGYGCAREIIEKVMKVQSKWFDREEHSKNLNEFSW